MGKAPRRQWSCWGGGGLAIMDQHLLAPAFLMSLPHHLLLTQREQPQQCRAQACSRVRALVCTAQRPQLPVSLCSFQTEQALGLERKRAQTRVKETGGQSLNCLPLSMQLGSHSSEQELLCSLSPKPAVTPSLSHSPPNSFHSLVRTLGERQYPPSCPCRGGVAPPFS